MRWPPSFKEGTDPWGVSRVPERRCRRGPGRTCSQVGTEEEALADLLQVWVCVALDSCLDWARLSTDPFLSL